MTARSLSASRPTSFAGIVVLSESVTASWVASCTTWSLVTMRPSVSIKKPEPMPCGCACCCCCWPKPNVGSTARLVMFTTDALFCWYTPTAAFCAPLGSGCPVCACAIVTCGAAEGEEAASGDEAVSGEEAVSGGETIADGREVEVAAGWALWTAQAANRRAVVAELVTDTTAVRRNDRTSHSPTLRGTRLRPCPTAPRGHRPGRRHLAAFHRHQHLRH